MFAILNRFRGTKGYWSQIIGVFIGAALWLLLDSVALGVLTTITYVLGESFGWGKWIGGIMHGNHGPATITELGDEEGRSYGIHQLANWIAPELENYYKYCVTALGIRGFYWFALTLLPLFALGFISLPVFLVASIVLGIAFPLSVIIGINTAEKFGWELGFFKMHGAWEHAEVWYGLMQDIVFIALILILL